jgi:hypothetical protein
MIIGITGHQELREKGATRRALVNIVSALMPCVGLTSLAAGTDQLFAEVCGELGVTYQAVIPASHYASSFASDSDRLSFLALCSSASEVICLPFAEPSESAFLAAGRWIAQRSDAMIAVWDGQPSHGLGGTADIVEYARLLGKPVHVIEQHRREQ